MCFLRTLVIQSAFSSGNDDYAGYAAASDKAIFLQHNVLESRVVCRPMCCCLVNMPMQAWACRFILHPTTPYIIQNKIALTFMRSLPLEHPESIRRRGRLARRFARSQRGYCGLR